MRTLNQIEAQGWSEQVRRRTGRIFVLAFLILLTPALLIAARLFLTGE
jgi:hypothetical protein